MKRKKRTSPSVNVEVSCDQLKWLDSKVDVYESSRSAVIRMVIKQAMVSEKGGEGKK